MLVNICYVQLALPFSVSTIRVTLALPFTRTNTRRVSYHASVVVSYHATVVVSYHASVVVSYHASVVVSYHATVVVSHHATVVVVVSYQATVAVVGTAPPVSGPHASHTANNSGKICHLKQYDTFYYAIIFPLISN